MPRTIKTNTVDFNFGKIPPQAKEMEGAILGAIMIQKEAFDIAHEIIKTECFYVDAHQKIFAAAESLASKSRAIDMLTIREELIRLEQLDSIGGVFYLMELTKSVVSSAHIEDHCRIVLQKYILREMIRVGGTMLMEAYEDSADVFDLLDKAEQNLFGVSFKNVKSDYKSINKGVVKVIDRVEKLRSLNTHIIGIPSGFNELDRVMAGWQAPDLTVIAARPSVGKTALSLAFARNANMSEKKTKVGFFSMEMNEEQLIQRLVSSESGIPLAKIIRGKLDEAEMKILYDVSMQKVAKMGIFIDDTPALNIYELRTKARRMKNKDGVGMIVIDYLQLMSGMQNKRTDNREQEISKISRDLKQLAKELQIPVIALSQLSRDVEKRSGNNKMPVLSDLRESGAIEQDADNVLFIYRPEYYDKENNENTNGETRIRIAKHRNGALETIKLKAQLHIQKFTDWDGAEQPKESTMWDAVKTENKPTQEDLPF